MNKSVSKLCFSTLLAVVLTGCANEDEVVNTTDRVVSFTTTSLHRASGTSWDKGDAIGVFMEKAVEPAGSLTTAKYTTANGDGNFTSTQPLYYPADGSQVNFVAYYPYDATLSSTTYPVDVTDQSVPANIDLMYANNLQGLSLTNRNARLEFSHQLSTLTLELKSADGTALTGISATVSGTAAQAGFDMATGTFSAPYATADIAMNIAPVTATSATATALLIPGNYPEGIKVKLELNGKVQTLAPTLTQLSKGENYSYTINVSGGGQGGETEAVYFKRTETPVITNEQLAKENLHYIVHMMASDPKVRNYAMLYDSDLKISYWVAYPLCNYYTKGSGERTDEWGYDPSISTQLQANLTKGMSGYDRGHQIPSADRLTTNADNAMTFYYTNMTPQLGQGLNQGIWANLENKVRGWSSSVDTLFVVTGAMPTTQENTSVSYTKDNDGRQIAIPQYYFKALARKIGGTFQTIAFKLDQKKYSDPNGYMDCAISVSDLEKLTGFTFFPSIDETTKQTLDKSKWQ